MKSLILALALLVPVVSSAADSSPRPSFKIIALLEQHASSMPVVGSDASVLMRSADAFVDAVVNRAEDRSAACLEVSPGIESCVVTYVIKARPMDGGRESLNTKVLLFNMVNGVPSGNVMMVQ